MIDKEKMETAINSGLTVLAKTLDEAMPTDLLLKQARIASSILSTGARYEANQNSRLGMQIRIATVTLKNIEERHKYLAISSPELKLLTKKRQGK